MRRKDKVNTILQRVAWGVWIHHESMVGPVRQCAFCGRSPESGCVEDCPSRMAREVIGAEESPVS